MPRDPPKGYTGLPGVAPGYPPGYMVVLTRESAVSRVDLENYEEVSTGYLKGIWGDLGGIWRISGGI